MRKPDPDDLCICSHARYAHLALTDGCTLCEETCSEFRLKIDYRILVETWLEYPAATVVRVSRDLGYDILSVFASQPAFTGTDFFNLRVKNRVSLLGKELSIDDILTGRELAFYAPNAIAPERAELT